MRQPISADVLIVGGGLGGCAAAMAAAKAGKRVILTEETDWIGGQVTSQAVPPDEHRWIEQFGCTRTYRTFRDNVRAYYKRNFPLTPEAAANPRLDPGNGIVSRLCVEPRAALAVLHDMMAPYVQSGRIELLVNAKPVAATSDGNRVESVTVRLSPTGEELTLRAPYVLDATECGDVLPLAGVEYVTGAESKSETGEPNALDGDAEPQDMQAFTYVFALDYREGEDHTIAKPRDYDEWKTYKAPFMKDVMLSWATSNLSPFQSFSLFRDPTPGVFSLWEYRRVIDKANFIPGTFDSDITLVNWPQNDYWLGSIIDVAEEERDRQLERAKQLSLSLLYWLQTEAPRPDGGFGYPGLRLRKDVVGTADGLAKAPYIRESRRIRAEFTVLEQHISPDVRGPGRQAEKFADSVGIGCYRIDLHPTTGGREGFYIPSLPFQIPLGSLIPVRVDNLLPACKNIGVTHLTNGCYRLHPVEWNVGEAAGHLAAYCLDRGLTPREVRNTESHLRDFQAHLVREGIELDWPVISAV
ncbi:FAD-dependent oxidoreductase [Paenibacillus flagellatus]|uniref:FAD-dependent oxidoreductase n=1 Tax=Paenibacillus flagellatus TaxID=2211139 RepID=A0A2V5K090_9BACL|nr:FAD-dependent oxidoreductase [Paenibacillus flagellatus]PYI52615.1 FAD-dependent oxidoreductase [Paenibacillus flagellatus]